MALNLVVAVLDRGPRDLAEMAVLLAIADSADRDTGEAWPSQGTIADRARQTVRSVRNVLERLRASKWLTWEDRKRPNGSTTSKLYTINLAMLGETPRNRVPVGAEPRSGGGGTTFRGGAEPRSTHAPEPRSAPEPSQKIEPVKGGLDFDLKERVSRSVACSDGVGGSAVCTRSASLADRSFDAWLKLPLAGKPSFAVWSSSVALASQDA